MRKLKKWIALALTAGMALSVFAGCSGGTASSGAASEAASEAASAASETASGTESTSGEGGNDALKIAIVSSPSGVDDGSFNQDVYTGILNFIDEHPDSSVTPVKEPTGDTAAAVQAVTDIVADYDVLVCSGYQFAGIGTLAQENPDKDFILIDSYPTDADGATVEVDNIYAMTFAEQEGGFFAGIAAAMETKSNKVAVVNGVAYPSNINYQYGFECGVKYVNETQGQIRRMRRIAQPGRHGCLRQQHRRQLHRLVLRPGDRQDRRRPADLPGLRHHLRRGGRLRQRRVHGREGIERCLHGHRLRRGPV